MAASEVTAWTAIVVSCHNQDGALAMQEELKIRQKKGLISKDSLLLTVEDPQARIGSGGATLNALLVVAEHLSQQEGFTVVNADVLINSRILIMHVGRNYAFSGCGRAFLSLPAQRRSQNSTEAEDLVTNFDCLLDTITHKLSPGSPPGVWISSTDMLLAVEEDLKIDWSIQDGAVGFAVPASEQYAKNHGMYRINKDGYVDDIIYQGGKTAMKLCQIQEEHSEAQLERNVALVAGVVFLSTRVAEGLLSLHVSPPLDACTYMGLDSGVKPLQLSLFFDILLALASDVNEDEYISGEHSKTYDNAHRKGSVYGTGDTMMVKARSVIWKALHGMKMKAVILPSSSHHYLTDLGNEFWRLLTSCPLKNDEDASSLYDWRSLVHVFKEDTCIIDESSNVVNCALQDGVKIEGRCFISHCHLKCQLTVEKDCILTNISKKDSQFLAGAVLPPGTILQGFHLKLGSKSVPTAAKVYTVLGKMDHLKTTFIKGTSSFCNSPWVVVLNRLGIDKEDLWSNHMTEYDRTLYNAKLFPVWHACESVGLKETLWLMQGEADPVTLSKWRNSWRLSFEEIQNCIDVASEFHSRRQLYHQIGQLNVSDILSRCLNESPLPFFKSAVIKGLSSQVLDCLDEVACQTTSPGVAARTLACIADVLGAMAKGKGGLRSGPAGNRQWQPAFQLLEAGKMAEGVQALARKRLSWIDNPDRMMRAARHYEGAAQILIRQAVMTARQFISTESAPLPPKGTWVVARCPSRIDVSGGWSDTPPITYENGGAVVDAAILLDGKKPIGAKVRRIEEPCIILVLGSDPNTAQRLILTQLSDLADYTNPQAPGALLKAAFCCAEVVSFPSDKDLVDQLNDKYQGGFELQTWSDLPTGSGLGTSSILAGAVIAVLWKASGKQFDSLSLIHAVLHLEQMLTTGGGWQDQVGGLLPGLNIGRSKAELPLKVTFTPLKVSPETCQKFNDHFILVYTGRTRLARNLLQDVIRNWYARLPQILTNCQKLIENAEDCAKAFEEGDFHQVGNCMNIYWTQKKVMAPGCEPAAVRRMMDVLGPHVHGQALAGAGGGGFMYVLTKKPNAAGKVRELLKTVEGTENVTVHSVTLDQVGIEMSLELSEDSIGPVGEGEISLVPSITNESAFVTSE